MSKRPKNLELLEKYAEKMHKGLCGAADLDPKTTGRIGALLRSMVDCYYGDLDLQPWNLKSSIQLAYSPKERFLYLAIRMDDSVSEAVAKEIDLESLKKQFVNYYLQPSFYKEKDIFKFELQYSERNISMKNLEQTVYRVMEQFFTDEIDKILDPVMKKIKENAKKQ